jgi:hypothetical protein
MPELQSASKMQMECQLVVQPMIIILDTRMYEIKYLDGYKASLAANTIAENLFAQVDEEENYYMLMDTILADHHVDGSQLKHDEALIFFSSN